MQCTDIRNPDLLPRYSRCDREFSSDVRHAIGSRLQVYPPSKIIEKCISECECRDIPVSGEAHVLFQECQA